MITGDLVTLSAYGRKVQGYMTWRDGYGLITKSFQYAGEQRIKLVWFHPNGKTKKVTCSFRRKDLKKFKPKGG